MEQKSSIGQINKENEIFSARIIFFSFIFIWAEIESSYPTPDWETGVLINQRGQSS